MRRNGHDGSIICGLTEALKAQVVVNKCHDSPSVLVLENHLDAAQRGEECGVRTPWLTTADGVAIVVWARGAGVGYGTGSVNAPVFLCQEVENLRKGEGSVERDLKTGRARQREDLLDIATCVPRS